MTSVTVSAAPITQMSHEPAHPILVSPLCPCGPLWSPCRWSYADVPTDTVSSMSLQTLVSPKMPSAQSPGLRWYPPLPAPPSQGSTRGCSQQRPAGFPRVT